MGPRQSKYLSDEKVVSLNREGERKRRAKKSEMWSIRVFSRVFYVQRLQFHLGHEFDALSDGDWVTGGSNLAQLFGQFFLRRVGTHTHSCSSRPLVAFLVCMYWTIRFACLLSLCRGKALRLLIRSLCRNWVDGKLWQEPRGSCCLSHWPLSF